MENEESKTAEQQAEFDEATVGTPPLHEQSPAEEAPPDAHCPNCNGPGIRKGKVILCQVCDAGFRYTKEGATVDELGPFDDHERRISVLEGSGVIEAQPPEPAEAQPPEPAEAQPAEPARAQPAETNDDDGI